MFTTRAAFPRFDFDERLTTLARERWMRYFLLRGGCGRWVTGRRATRHRRPTVSVGELDVGDFRFFFPFVLVEETVS